MKFKINGKEWKIKKSKQGELLDIRPDTGKIFGLCQTGERVIHITSDHPVATFRETVIHELVHAFLDSFGMRGTEVVMNEEQVCEFVAMNMDNILEITNKYLTKSK